VPDETPLWAGLSAAEVVRRMYRWLAIDGWSCQQVARELNELAIPTHYGRDGRGVRWQRTRGTWASGRVRNMIVAPLFRGELRYGQRSMKPQRELIVASVEPLVSRELWLAAQATLAAHRLVPKNTHRLYLLRGVVTCGMCGLTYIGSQGRADVSWYRCNGQLKERGPIAGRCPGRSFRADHLEPLVWADVERFLRHPGDVLADLDASAEREAQTALAEAEAVTLRHAAEALEVQQQRAINLVVKGPLSEDALRPELQRIAAERAEVERRLAAAKEPPMRHR
jgi:site-specific DNA recombinase